jgi:hypothetical protein
MPFASYLAFPADIQIYSLFAAAIATGAKDPAAAQYVLQALTMPAAKRVLKARASSQTNSASLSG